MVSAVNFLTGVLLARYLGLVEFGIYALALSAISFTVNLQDSTILSSMQSLGPKQAHGKEESFFNLIKVEQFVFSLLSGIVLLIGVIIANYMFPSWDCGKLAMPIAATCIFVQLQDFLRRYFFTIRKPSKAFANDFISYIGQIACLVLLFYAGNVTSVAVLWVIAVTSAIAVLVGLQWTEPARKPMKSEIEAVSKRQWGFSKWLTASAIMRWITSHFFTVISAAYLGVGAAGALRACQNILGVLHILFFGLGNVVPMQAAKYLHESGIRKMVSYMKKVTILGGGVTALFTAIIAIAPEFWLSLIYSEEYTMFSFVLRWFCLVYLIRFLCSSMIFGLRALEFTEANFWAYSAATLFTVTCFDLLLNNYKLQGAMIGIFITQLIIFLVLLIFFRKKTKEAACSEKTNENE